MHGVNTISRAYTVFGLCFIIILHFDSNNNSFGMDFGIFGLLFFLLYFLIGWRKIGTRELGIIRGIGTGTSS